MGTQIPDGYELLAGRNRGNAIKALATAEERGLAPELVRTTTDGYLIPLATVQAESIDAPNKRWDVADIDAFADRWGIDLSGAKNKGEKLAMIDAEIEKRTDEQFGADESKKED